jgi:hypothetical protein
MTSEDEKEKADREALVGIGVLFAYHAPILAVMLYEVIFDGERVERVLNDPDNRWIVILACLAVMAGTWALSYLFLFLPMKRRNERMRRGQ